MTAKILIPYSIAIPMSAFIALAAFGKIVYPSLAFPILDRWVGGAEALLLVPILLFCKKWWMWSTMSQMFAFYTGYTLFWLKNGMPCGCMGSSMLIPTSLSFSIDALFFFFSLYAAQFLYVSRKGTYVTILLGMIVAFVGYGFAEWLLIHRGL